MTIEPPPLLSLARAHDRARDDVNRWRGHCVDLFSRIERAMADVLARMALAGGGGIKGPQTFGARVAALAAKVAREGDFPNPALVKSIDAARPLLDQRNRIIHATGTISVERNGEWLWNYRFRPSGKAEDSGFYECQEAKAFERDLQRTTQSLCAKLDNLAKKLGKVEPASTLAPSPRT